MIQGKAERPLEMVEKQPVRYLEIAEDDAGQRIDHFLIRELKGVPKSRIYRMLRKGEVRVSGRRVKPSYRLQEGDRVRIPPVVLGETQAPEEIVTTLYGRRLEERILYEDEALLVIDKPSGMAVHGGSGLLGGVIEGLRRVRPHSRVLELVHRLDRETSGVLLIAKKRSALRKLHEAFREGEVEKRYLALLAWRWQEEEATIDAPLRKFQLKGGERWVVVDRERGKPACTRFRRLRLLRDATLVEAEPKTGRTHQIRVHAASMGHPILGDERYGSGEANERWRERGLTRLFLHAASMAFRHPKTGKWLEISSPLPEELDRLLKRGD